MISIRPYIIQAVYNWLIDNHCTPYLLVDANREGVSVPRSYVKNGKITLNCSAKAVRNFGISNVAIQFDARFGGESFSVYLPMNSVVAIFLKESNRWKLLFAEDGSFFGESEEELVRGTNDQEAKPYLRFCDTKQSSGSKLAVKDNDAQKSGDEKQSSRFRIIDRHQSDAGTDT